MRRVLAITILGFVIIALASCKDVELRKQYSKLMDSTIVLPANLTCVNKGEITTVDSLRDTPKLIVYVDSTQCTTCWISHVEMYHDLFSLSEENGLFQVVLMLPNIDLDGIPITRYLSDWEIEHPIYVDVDNEFLKLNPVIPNDRRLHAFLIDGNGSPLCVGDPIGSDNMFQVFLKALDTLINYSNS